MKIYSVVHLYDIGSGHPEVTAVPCLSYAEAEAELRRDVGERREEMIDAFVRVGQDDDAVSPEEPLLGVDVPDGTIDRIRWNDIQTQQDMEGACVELSDGYWRIDVHELPVQLLMKEK